MKKRKKYTAEFKREAVRLAETSGRTQAHRLLNLSDLKDLIDAVALRLLQHQ